MNFLWIATSPNLTTGYGILSKNVVERLIKKGHSIKQLGLHTIGHPGKEYDYVLPMGENGNASDVIKDYVEIFNIDTIITATDIWLDHFIYLPKFIRSKKLKWIHHATVNTTPVPPILMDRMKTADVIIAPSKYVEKELLDCGFKRNKVVYIPHGVNIKTFNPFSFEKKQLLKSQFGYSGKFVFGAVMVNKPRQKSYSQLFHAYRMFLDTTEAEDTILHCHCNPISKQGVNLLIEAKTQRLDDKVYFTEYYNRDAGLIPKDMAKLYNVFDCLVESTWGESFGLPVLESMACGTPVIMTDYSTANELLKIPKTGLVADVKAMVETPVNAEQAYVDSVSLAKQMIRIYNDNKLREKLSKRSVKFARTYDWDKVIIPKYWIPFLESQKDSVMEYIKEENK